MPYVNVKVLEGLTRQQKSEIVRDITTSFTRVLNKNPEHIHIVIDEVTQENWGFAVLLTDDWIQQQKSGQQE